MNKHLPATDQKIVDHNTVTQKVEVYMFSSKYRIDESHLTGITIASKFTNCSPSG